MRVKDKEIDFEIRSPRERYNTVAVSNQNCEKLPNDEWLRWRQHGPHWDDPTHPDYIDFAFGGSSQGAICNCEDAFMTKLQYYHEKLGIKPAINLPKNEVPLKLGHIYERSIGDKFQYWMSLEHSSIGIKLYYDKRMFRCMKKNADGTLRSPYCLMDIDGLLEITNQKGEKGLIIYEAKTIDKNNFDKINKVKKGIIPKSYMCQLMYYMYGMNLMAAVIVFSWGQGLDDMAAVWVERNYEAEEELLRYNDEFYRCLQAKIQPPVNEMPQRALNKYYSYFLKEPPKGAPKVTLDSSYKDNVERAIEFYNKRMELEAELKKLKREEEKYLDRIAPVFGNYSSAIYDLGNGQQAEITLKRAHFSDRVDEENLRVEHPDVYERYLKPSFDFTAFKKGEDKEIVEKYTIKGDVNPNPSATQTPRFDIRIRKKNIMR